MNAAAVTGLQRPHGFLAATGILLVAATSLLWRTRGSQEAPVRPLSQLNWLFVPPSS